MARATPSAPSSPPRGSPAARTWRGLRAAIAWALLGALVAVTFQAYQDPAMWLPLMSALSLCG